MKKNLIITLLFFISIFNSTISKALNSNIPLSEELAIVEGITGCWSIPLGLPTKNLSVRIKLELRPDGTVSKTEVLDQEKMNKSNNYNKVYVESILRAIKQCQPLKVPITGNSYKRWKVLTLNAEGFDGLYLNVKPTKLAEMRWKEQKKRLLEEKKIAEIKKKVEEKKTAKILKKFEEERKKTEAETKKNLNFINNFNKKNNLIEFNCFAIDAGLNTEKFRFFIDDKLKKAVEIFPNGEVKILHTVKSHNNANAFRLDLHSVKISSGFYSKEEIIINNYLSLQQRDGLKRLDPTSNTYVKQTMNDYLAEHADEEIRTWLILKKGMPFPTALLQSERGSVNRVHIMDDSNRPTGSYFSLHYLTGHTFFC